MTARKGKAQSALEYLTTYGWALLIIAIVFFVLFEINILSIGTQGYALPGSCTVVNSGGVGQSALLSLQGACNGAAPKFVPEFTNGGYVEVANLSSLIQNENGGFTVAAWFEVGKRGAGQHVLNTTGRLNSALNFQIVVNSSGLNDVAFVGSTLNRVGSVSSAANAISNLSDWYYVAGVYTPSSVFLYLNGQLVGTASVFSVGPISLPSPMPLFIGASDPSAGSLHGSISNVQIYSRALSSNEIRTMYQSGIGGLPIDISSLTNWYPLNGDSNDYSVSQENGAANSITYSSTWLATTKLP